MRLLQVWSWKNYKKCVIVFTLEKVSFNYLFLKYVFLRRIWEMKSAILMECLISVLHPFVSTKNSVFSSNCYKFYSLKSMISLQTFFYKTITCANIFSNICYKLFSNSPPTHEFHHDSYIQVLCRKNANKGTRTIFKKENFDQR